MRKIPYVLGTIVLLFFIVVGYFRFQIVDSSFFSISNTQPGVLLSKNYRNTKFFNDQQERLNNKIDKVNIIVTDLKQPNSFRDNKNQVDLLSYDYEYNNQTLEIKLSAYTENINSNNEELLSYFSNLAIYLALVDDQFSIRTHQNLINDVNHEFFNSYINNASAFTLKYD